MPDTCRHCALPGHTSAKCPGIPTGPAEPSAVVTLSPTADPDEITLAAESHGMNPARVAYGLRLAADEFDHRARAQGDEPIPYPAALAEQQPTCSRSAYAAGLIEAATLAEQGRVTNPMGEAEEHVNDCFTDFAATLRRKAAEAQQ